MKIIHTIDEYAGPGAVVALGTFDGVHIGHQKLIAAAIARARVDGLDAAVCTFDRHPLALLAPDKAPEALLSQVEKLEKFMRLGVDVALVLPFTREFADQPPRAFLEVLVRGLRAKALVVGENYTFGRGGAGDCELIRALATELGYEAVVVEAVKDEGEVVSSTLIRRLIAEGEAERVERLLGEKR